MQKLVQPSGQAKLSRLLDFAIHGCYQIREFSENQERKGFSKSQGSFEPRVVSFHSNDFLHTQSHIS